MKWTGSSNGWKACADRWRNGICNKVANRVMFTDEGRNVEEAGTEWSFQDTLTKCGPVVLYWVLAH